jgi:hypothetical protein
VWILQEKRFCIPLWAKNPYFTYFFIKKTAKAARYPHLIHFAGENSKNPDSPLPKILIIL